MKIGVIGCGNLGSSIIKGLLKSESLKPEAIIASDPDKEKLEELGKLGVKTTTDNQEATEESEVIIIAVKPSLVGKVLEELGVSKEKLIISVAAGVSTDFLERHTDARVIRVMPNICGRVAEMASCYTLGKFATKDDEKLVKDLLWVLGLTFKIDKELMDTVTGLSGSGPAFIFLVIQGLRDAGIDLGLSEDVALKLASQTVKGSGEMALNSGESLEELIDMVSSPKGTTIEGLKILEDQEVREAFEDAV
ncbi:hypothetical protein AKJ46_00730, partial [candidate division MSBL1 archaeon SCGC-AAA833K04]